LIKKRLWGLILVLCMVMILVAVGCSKSNTTNSDEDKGDSKSDSKGDSKSEITIEYWQYHYPSKVDLVNELIKEFEASNPGVKVKHTTFPYDQYNEKVATLVPAGRGPDVINLYYGWVPKYVDSGYLQPLSQDAFPHDQIEKEFFPLVEAVKLNGEYWTIPTAVRTLALFYNKDLFESAGLDPNQPPTTWNELVDYSKQATVRDSDGKLITEGMAWEPGGQGHNWFRDALLYQAGGNGLSEDRKKIQWADTPAGLEAFEYYLSFPGTHKVGERNFYENDVTAFKTGNAAMNVDGSFRLGTLAQDAPDLNYAIAPLPSYKEKATQASFWSNGITARVEGEKLEAANKFLQFLTSKDVMERWLSDVGELPAKSEVALQDKYLNDPLYGAFMDQLPNAHAHFFVDEKAERDAVIEAVDEVLVNGKPIEDAYKEMVEKTQKIFDEYWKDK
jgi:multiple sugar transport system substrate-binding protein